MEKKKNIYVVSQYEEWGEFEEIIGAFSCRENAEKFSRFKDGYLESIVEELVLDEGVDMLGRIGDDVLCFEVGTFGGDMVGAYVKETVLAAETFYIYINAFGRMSLKGVVWERDKVGALVVLEKKLSELIGSGMWGAIEFSRGSYGIGEKIFV